MAFEVYKPSVVEGIIGYYGGLLYDYPIGITIKERLELLSSALWKAYKADNPVVRNEINNYHPKFISQSWEEVRKNNFTEEDAYVALAKQYGYDNWTEVPDFEVDLQFEKTVDVLLSGNVSLLSHLIKDDPTLVSRQSRYAHQASLIHYVGSNGFELYRQVVPMNLTKILQLLINEGCDLDAKMKVYGGMFTMLELMNTSIHPKDAGLITALQKVCQP